MAEDGASTPVAFDTLSVIAGHSDSYRQAVSYDGSPTQTPDPYFAALRDREFARLDETGLAYLDYTGSAIPAARLHETATS